MNFLQLEYFMLVVENASFSIAAEKAFTSQSSVSKHIHSLEEELNVTLFHRTAHVPLTEAGKIFFPHAQALLKIHDELCKNAKKFQITKYDTFNVACIPFMAPYHITEVIAKYNANFPQVNLTVSECSTEEQLRLLNEGRLDFGIVYRNSSIPQVCNKVHLCHDELVILANPEHPMAKIGGDVPLKNLKDETLAFLGLDVDTLLHDYIIDLCRRASFTPRRLKFDGWVVSLKHFLEKNLCVALLPRTVAEFYYGKNFKIIPLSEHPPLDLTLIYNKGRLSDSHSCLIDMIKDSFEKTSR